MGRYSLHESTIAPAMYAAPNATLRQWNSVTALMSSRYSCWCSPRAALALGKRRCPRRAARSRPAKVATFNSPWAMAFLPGSADGARYRKAGADLAGRCGQRQQAAGRRRSARGRQRARGAARHQGVARLCRQPIRLSDVFGAFGERRQRTGAGARPAVAAAAARGCRASSCCGTTQRGARAASSARSSPSRRTASRCS